MTTRIENPTVPARLSIRTVLLLDAGVSGLNGVVYLAAAPLALDDLLGPSVRTLVVLGAALLVWALALDWVATRRPVPAAYTREVAAFNLLWVAGSVAALFLLDLTTLGTVWCVLQALVVAGFAALQLRLAADER